MARAKLSPTDQLVAESERLRLWLLSISAGLRTFSDELEAEAHALREETEDDQPGE
jgi:hypothetical protein